MEYRILSTSEELEACIALQKTIWGLEDLGVTSPIILKSLCTERPAVGLITGAFDGETLVGFSLNMGTLEPGLAYGPMFGVLEQYRDSRVGVTLMEYTNAVLRERGVREVSFTYEPLESRNAYFYLNKCKGRAVAYEQAHYHVHSAMNDGLPLDRMLATIPIGEAEIKAARPVPDSAEGLPVATAQDMPGADMVLVRIPGDLATLKERDMDRAMRVRLDTRAVFSEYLNGRGYEAIGLVSEAGEQGRVSHYVLARGGDS